MGIRKIALTALLVAMSAGAQDAPPPDTIPVQAAEPEPEKAAGQPELLDSIEVTATRRKERLLDVPVAVTAMTRDQVESRGIQRLDDLNSLAPGLQISRSPSNTTISQITIRGSSQINPAIYWDPAVGVYLDGVYIGKSQGSIFNVVDLESVEVLRGPQGTLYGRNTIGGTINFITREPSGVFSGNASVEFGNFNALVGRASIDLPHLWIADFTVGVRAERRDGWVDEIDDDPVSEHNERDNEGLHVASRLDLFGDLEGLYRYDRGRVDQTHNHLQLYRFDLPGFERFVQKERQTTADIDSEPFEHSDVEGHSLTLTWPIGERNELKSITARREVRWEDSLDLDGTPNMLAHTVRLTDYEQLSQDLNLTGHTDSWKYVIGVYLFEDDGYTDNPQSFYFGALNFDSRYGTHTKARAAYGQVDWQVFERLTLTAGLRYTSEEKVLDRVLGFTPADFAAIAEALGQDPPPQSLPSQPYVYLIPEGFSTPPETFKATTPMASIAWAFSDRVNTYLRYAEGFKSGGFNGEYSNIQETPAENQAETSTPFRPEMQSSIELGLKSALLGGRALLNVALFSNKLEDLQISTFTGQGAASSVIRNAGKATVRGAEIEAAVMPFDGTQLRVNYAFLDAQYDEFIDEGQNAADNRAFVHAPEHSWNAVLDSELFARDWGVLRAVVDYVWTDSFYTYPYQLAPDPDPVQPKQEAPDTEVQAHGLLNARVSFSGIRVGNAATAEIAIWGRNLTDDATANNFIDFGPGLFQSLTVANYEEPRTFGIAGILRW